MTNGTASETNGNGSLPCPGCGCYEVVHERLYLTDIPVLSCGDGCGFAVFHGEDSTWDELHERWNRRAAVTDHDFAMAVHDGRTWVCMEAAMESDALKPIPGFTRDSIYRDSMREYGEWIRKATELMRDIWTTTTWEYGMTDEHRDGLRRRLEEFGIEACE